MLTGQVGRRLIDRAGYCFARDDINPKILLKKKDEEIPEIRENSSSWISGIRVIEYRVVQIVFT